MSAPRITDEQQAETFAVRLVPISASQIQALESLARAFSGLTTDFWRDYGADHDDRIAGGLYRLCSTLEMIVAQWRDDSEDVALVEARRRVLEQIARGRLTPEDASRLAALTLQLPTATE
jgi:hypothetical protein